MDKFYEERIRRLRERVLNNEKNLKAKKEEVIEESLDFNVSKEEVFDETVDVGKLTKNEIKAILDKEGVEYKASDSKDQLLKLLEK